MSIKTLNSIPLKDKFYMPAEWEKHQSMWILWPQRTDNWRNGAKPAQKTFCEVISKIAKYTLVLVGVNADQYDNAFNNLKNVENIQILEIANNDSWIRDCGFTALKNEQGKIRIVDWDFNAWGGLKDGLYFPWNLDDQVALKMAQFHQFDRYKPDNFVLEGGSIHSDGKGTILTTEACLLSEGRNPHLNKETIETYLKNYLGAKKIIWLPNGIYNDETNEHVDNFACFAPNNQILLAWTDDQSDPQYASSKKAYDILQKATDANNEPFKIIKVHTPNHVLITEQEAVGIDLVSGTLPRQVGDRQAASYVNFLITNKTIILPQFNDALHDKQAVETIKKTFLNYHIETVQSREIVLGGGNIHCITQQVPLGIKND